MSIFFVLICVVSLVLQSSVSLNIYNKYQDINLTSPAYFIHGGKWHAVHDQEMGINAEVRSYFEFYSGQDVLEGALIYKLQRRQHAESDKLIQDESKIIQLLVAWHVEHTKEPHVHALLVEHDREFDWDKDKLKRIHQKYWHSFNAFVSSIEDNWLLNDVTVLLTSLKWKRDSYAFEITISEGTREGSHMEPLWVSSNM
jgi:hypothetical protein